jgi:sulfite dehydrogenase
MNRSVHTAAKGVVLSALVVMGHFSMAADDAAQLQQGKVLFQQGAVPACALCHALNDAGAEGAVGPSLDELKPDAKRVATALRNGIGQMPSFNGKLSEAQIAALAIYVAKASGGSK